ncbi:TPM domain-containing protein [Sulfurimonas sp. HSL3-2]|uniref:TPM domain-containing protein n=1 Tax=Hydrocurvibacter mobilis TaxID=3131936 RepID=UPI0031F9111D
MRLLSRLGILLVLIGFLNLNAQEIHFPSLSGRVVDEANILTGAQKKQLTDQLQTLEKQTSDQVVVVTLKSLQGNTIEVFGFRLGRHWQIGQKEKNNGVLLIVAPKERKVRIEVGYGLEGILTDGLSKMIIDNDIVPSFKKGNMQEGIMKGTKSILEVLQGQYVPPKKNNVSRTDKGAVSFGVGVAVFFGLLFAAPLFNSIINNMLLISIVNSIIVFFTFVGVGPLGEAFAMGVFMFFGSIVTMMSKYQVGSDSWYSPNGSFSSGSSSFGSSGFSGGGGSFGGGGASGSW